MNNISYLFQSTKLCKAFIKTLKSRLSEILKCKCFSKDLFIDFAVLSFNHTVCFFTRFTLFDLTFASVARLPLDHICGSHPARLHGDPSPSRGLVSLRFKSYWSCLVILVSFVRTFKNKIVREKHCKRNKIHNHIGAKPRVFSRDIVNLKLKSRSKGPSNFQSELSSPHEVISIKGVAVTLKLLLFNRIYVVHYRF